MFDTTYCRCRSASKSSSSALFGDADTTGAPRFGINTLDSDMIMQLAEVI
jgi:hypothetical protein